MVQTVGEEAGQGIPWTKLVWLGLEHCAEKQHLGVPKSGPVGPLQTREAAARWERCREISTPIRP